MMKFIKNQRNEVLIGEGFYISFNKEVCSLINDTLMNIFGLTEQPEETALCIENKDKSINSYLILNGDFREQYKKLAPKGLDACVEFYEKNKHELGSAFTTDFRITEQEE